MKNKYDYECSECSECVELKYYKDSKFPWDKLQGYCQNCHLNILISLKDYLNYLDENFLKTPRELLEIQKEPDFDLEYHDKKCEGGK